MTAVCLKAKSFIGTDALSGIFTDLNTETKSCLFIEQLTSICISSILYLRKVLPDDYFEDKSFEGITLKFLKSRNEDNSVSKLKQWLEGAFEAMEKKYLKRLMLDIQDTESNETLEIYTLTFNYNNVKETSSPSISTISERKSKLIVPNTKLNTMKLLQMCYAVTQTYSSLPTKVKLSMRLSYYDYAPKNYQPSGYIAWEFVEPEFPSQPRSIEIGVTETQHHFFKFIHKSCLNYNFFKLQGMNDEMENGSATLPLESPKKSGVIFQSQSFIQERQTKAQKKLFFHFNKSTETSSLHSSNKKPEHTYGAAEKYTEQKMLDKFKVRCACLSTDKLLTMFQCLGCKFVVHAECFGILQLEFSKKIRFYCHLCHQKEINFKCHDRVMISLKKSSDQQKLSLLRRVLGYCTMSDVKNITFRKMEEIAGMDCPKAVVNVVLNKMIEIGVAVPQKKQKKLLIHKKKLANNLAHYFYKIQNFTNSKSEVSTHNLNAQNKRKNDINELILHKRSKQSNIVIQEFINCNSQTSEQSGDIFC